MFPSHDPWVDGHETIRYWDVYAYDHNGEEVLVGCYTPETPLYVFY